MFLPFRLIKNRREKKTEIELNNPTQIHKISPRPAIQNYTVVSCVLGDDDDDDEATANEHRAQHKQNGIESAKYEIK